MEGKLHYETHTVHTYYTIYILEMTYIIDIDMYNMDIWLVCRCIIY